MLLSSVINASSCEGKFVVSAMTISLTNIVSFETNKLSNLEEIRHWLYALGKYLLTNSFFLLGVKLYTIFCNC